MKMTVEEFKAIRLDLGYSQDKMAKALDRALVTVQHWEYGINGIDHLTGEGIRAIAAKIKEKS